MSTSSASASTEEYIEILNAEQLVDLEKLRDYARHGVQSGVRGEVWLYLLGVLSADKSQEMTSVRSAYMEYDSLDKHNPYLEKRIRNESARYYQRKLIARPSPGRTLARSSQRLPSRLYASSRNHNFSGSRSNSSNDDSNGASSSTSMMNRGPNRVDAGPSRLLAGIMGSSAVLNSSALGATEDEELLMDPEAAAGTEMKRFCVAVEHIVCAHLNRWRWKGTNSIVRDETPSSTDSSYDRGRRRTSFGSNDEHTFDGAALTPTILSDDAEGQISRSRASTVSSAASYTGTHPQHSPIKPSNGTTKSSNGSNLFPLLPKEYQWAHQPAEVSATSTLFTLDSASLHGDQEFGQLVQPDYHPDLILLCSPFVKCIRVEAGMYFAFEKLMSMREEYYCSHPLPWQISTFLTLFRTTLPELHNYFEEEEVDMIGLASAWLRHLLAAELRIEDLMRLWDTYFAVPDPMELHMYVCIAILTNCKDALEELDQSEAKSMLFSLPPLDVDRILNEAINIRLSHRQSEITQGSQ